MKTTCSENNTPRDFKSYKEQIINNFINSLILFFIMLITVLLILILRQVDDILKAVQQFNQGKVKLFNDKNICYKNLKNDNDVGVCTFIEIIMR